MRFGGRNLYVEDDLQTVSRYGNKGGDHIILRETRDDDLLKLEVGHCCVVEFRGIVPVEFVTATLANALHEWRSGTLKLGWKPEYEREILDKIKPLFEWSLDEDEPKYDPPRYECKQCGNKWEVDHGDDDTGPYKCGRCGYIPDDLEIRREGVILAQLGLLGQEVGKWSFCSRCDTMTLNVPGKPSWQRNKEGVEISDEWPVCTDCGADKKRFSHYECPRCGAWPHYIIEIQDWRQVPGNWDVPTHYEWDQLMRCQECGEETWWDNSTA